MKSKKDKIIVAVAGVALTIVFLIALIIGDTSGLKVNDGADKSTEKYADDNGTSEGESTSNEDVSTNEEQSSGENESTTEETTAEPETEEPTEEPTTESAPKKEMFLVKLSDYVNVRAEASTAGEIVGKVYAKGGGEVIEKAGEWTKIKSGPVEGYVFTEYIWIGEEAEDNLKFYGTKIGTITTTDLRIRDSAGMDSNVLGYFDINAEVEILEEGTQWHKIKFDGKDAYIAAEFVDIRYEYGVGITAAEEAAALKAEQERLEALAAAEAQKKADRETTLDTAVANFDFSGIVRHSLYTNVTDEDIYLMMCVVSKECGHDVYEGQLAVANLILNRYNGKAYGDSVRDVLEAPNRFAVVTWDSFWVVVKNGPLPSSVKAVTEAISGVNNVPRYTNYMSLTGITAADYEIMKEYEVIGNQVFYSRK